jgi:uncharacterized membrane protein
MKNTILKNIMRVILALFMILAGIGHLTFNRNEFQAQVPRWLTNNQVVIDFVVIASGIIEFAIGIAILFVFKHRIKLGIALALFFIIIFPGNLSQYTNNINAFGLDTDKKRFIRLFFQPILVLWALYSTGAISYLFKRKTRR